MFFSNELLTSKDGPLAATFGPKNKKITRKQLTGVNLAKTCDLIAEPPEPIALRLSGALLVGVARVYNQNYDIFYSDVTNLDSNLRRSIATDFATSGTGTGGTISLDLPGGGKSRLDQITFPQAGLDFELGLDMQFQHIDWENPLNHGRKRRSSSMLSSQATQESKESDEEDSDEDDDEEDVESEMGRDRKRNKISSSPALGGHPSTTRTRNSIHHPSEPTGGALYAGIDVPMGEIDLGLDFGGMDQPVGDDSFSAPSGRDFELPEGALQDDAPMMDGGDFVLSSPPGSLAPEAAPADLPSEDRNTPKSALKSSKEKEGSEAGSADDAEQQLEEGKKRKAKKIKKVTFDSSTELDSAGDQEARKRYQEDMKRERAVIDAKAREKIIAATAAALIDGTGGLEFFDSEMSVFFSTFTRVEKFKWETDLAVHRLGKDAEQPEGPAGAEKPEEYQIDVFGDGDRAMPDADVFQDYEVPIQELSASGRQGSAIDPEHPRRFSHGSQQGPLPVMLIVNQSFSGFPDVGDDSFSPASLRLSYMTPQEAKLRSRSIPGSSTGPGSLGRRRHRSSSLMSDRPDDDPFLLVRGDDLDLPRDDEELQLDSLPPSQQARLADLPPAFRPEMLATLEQQCRYFFSYVERKMITLSLEELEFEDIAPLESKRHVAAVAFYDCLTLATKKILSVEQEEAWGPINVRFAVEST
uniref:Rad21/Rec8-like protein N-terminal domain-containing protein n=1 Tax=Kwoniella bestiolae CBS 10118 TaxID=1296100 RepID=A0A1B9FVW6_9TREE|nr:hypothetical protein I302_07258 [Kwoniella bestiolae CBS 10118]OCF22908.1 hypothetical protein I302_07258 [Kwoniella bestiolae CBS 10118]